MDHSAVKDCSLTTSNRQYFRGDKAGHSLLDIGLHVVEMLLVVVVVVVMLVMILVVMVTPDLLLERGV